jgi:hypothetical protein
MEHGWTARTGPEKYRFAAVASPEELVTDLALVEIIGNWLWRLADRERLLTHIRCASFDVHGYDGSCTLCRERWGQRERSLHWIPPFHPGCRCFAQPRYA